MKVLKQCGNIRLIDLELRRFPIYQIEKKHWLLRWKWKALEFDRMNWFTDLAVATQLYIRLLSKVVKVVFLRRGRFKTCPLLSSWRDLLTQGGF